MPQARGVDSGTSVGNLQRTRAGILRGAAVLFAAKGPMMSFRFCGNRNLPFSVGLSIVAALLQPALAVALLDDIDTLA